MCDICSKQPNYLNEVENYLKDGSKDEKSRLNLE